MTVTQDTPIAARIPGDLRAELERVQRQDGEKDLSSVLRKALRAYANARLGNDPGIGPAVHRHAGATEQEAAERGRRSGPVARERLLRLFGQAGGDGLTADEAVVLMAPYPPNATPRRVTDLKQLGHVEAVMYVGTSTPVTRPTRTGSPAGVYVITADGRAALEALNGGGNS